MDRRIEVVISKMESQISKPWEIGEMARLVNLSASRLRHLFKTETGKTPAQYLKYLRLQKAELLLRTTFLTIKEIANRVGLPTGSHFVREFKKVYRVAPTTYRSSPRLTTPARRSKSR
jgi:AraC family transcriptional regulator of arabinose operon